MVKEKLENSRFLLEDEPSSEEAWSIIFAYKWSPGEFCWIKSNGSKVVLLRPGDYIEHQRFERFRSGNMNIVFKSSVNIPHMETGINIFEELKFASEMRGDREERKTSVRKKYLHWSAPHLWNGETEMTLLEMISLFTRVFYELDQTSHQTFSNLPVPLQLRSLCLSSLICSTAFTIGYTDFKFLQDIFHLSLFFDLGLADEPYSYLFEDVLEKERLEPGAGERELREQKMEHKNNVLKMHPEKSVEGAQELLQGIIHHKDLLKLMMIHHETLDGKGFPRALNLNELNDLEKIIVSCCKSVPQTVDVMEVMKSNRLIFDYLAKGVEDQGFVQRLKSLVMSSYDSIDDSDKEYLEVVGF